MSFLHPLGLAVAALAAAPILLHLLRRETAQRVPFPALRYLRAAERRTSRTVRLRDLLLLATRVLIVLLLAVAAARPLAGRGDADDHAPTDVILLIDNSASMGRVDGDRTLFDVQLEAARRALDAATPADRFWVVPVVGSPLAAGVDATGARSALERITLTDAAGEVLAGLRDATTAVPVVEDRAREAQVYTDLQASGLAGSRLDLSSWGRVAISAPSLDASNGAVVALRLEPGGAVIPGASAAVVGTLARDPADPGGVGAQSPDTVEVRLVVDGETVALVRSAWNAEVVVRLPELAPGPHDVQLETSPSGLRSDDTRRIGVFAAEPPTVRVRGEGAGFAASAVETLREAGRVRAQGDEVVVILEGSGSVETDASALLLVPPVEAAVLPAFNQLLDELGVPWRLATQLVSGETRFPPESGVAGLELARVRSSYRLERLSAPATEDDSVLVRLEDGSPWAVRGRADGRGFVLLASALDPLATDLPAGVAMVPFVETAILRWMRPNRGPTGAVDAGSTMALPPRVESLTDPAGEEHTAEGGSIWTPEVAGTWRLGLPGGETRFVGVNVPPVESTVSVATTEQLEARIDAIRLDVVEQPDRWMAAVFGARRGADATPWVVGLLVLLALVETVLRSPRQVRPTHADAG